MASGKQTFGLSVISTLNLNFFSNYKLFQDIFLVFSSYRFTAPGVFCFSFYLKVVVLWGEIEYHTQEFQRMRDDLTTTPKNLRWTDDQVLTDNFLRLGVQTRWGWEEIIWPLLHSCTFLFPIVSLISFWKVEANVFTLPFRQCHVDHNQLWNKTIEM